MKLCFHSGANVVLWFSLSQKSERERERERERMPIKVIINQILRRNEEQLGAGDLYYV